MSFREVLRRDTDASELRNDILRKNALIADLTALNERNKKQNGEGGSSRSSFSDVHSVSDGAVELELAQTKVLNTVFFLDFIANFLLLRFAW